MNTAAPFLATILDAPDDDGPRLVYADWLDERGDVRGEFIRGQIEAEALLNNDPAITAHGKRVVKRRDAGMSIEKANNGCDCGHCAKYRAFRSRAAAILDADSGETEECGQCLGNGYYDSLEEACTFCLFGRAPVSNRRAWLAEAAPKGWATWENAGELRMGPGPSVPSVKVDFAAGLIDRAVLPLAAWCGTGNCERHGYGSDFRLCDQQHCQHCHGTGRVGALGPILCAHAPLREVELTGAEPLGVIETGEDGRDDSDIVFRLPVPNETATDWIVCCESREMRRPNHASGDMHVVPAIVFDRMKSEWSTPEMRNRLATKGFSSPALAVRAKDAAALEWGREMARRTKIKDRVSV